MTIHTKPAKPLDDPHLWKEDWREWVTAGAYGRVLELGAGDGVNLPYYASGVQVTATEPDPQEIELVPRTFPNVTLARVSAEDLAFPDATFDTVLCTLVFCSIPDAPRALQEVKRVLKPGGAFRLVEHVRAQGKLRGMLMDSLNPPYRFLAGGCNMNRDTLKAVRNAGFVINTVEKRTRGLIIGISAIKP